MSLLGKAKAQGSVSMSGNLLLAMVTVILVAVVLFVKL